MKVRKISPNSWHYKIFNHRCGRKWRVRSIENRCEYAAEVIKELFWFFFTGCAYVFMASFLVGFAGMLIHMMYKSYVFCADGFLTMTWFIALSIGLSIVSVYGARKANRKYDKAVFELEETKFYVLLYDYVIAKKNKACPPIELPKLI